VLAAETKLEQDGEGEKPMEVNVVTLLVNAEEAERLTLASPSQRQGLSSQRRVILIGPSMRCGLMTSSTGS
jgi:hypothetical protein